MEILKSEIGMNNTKIKLKVCDLEKKYGNKTALNSISFEVYSGEFLSILGPSGCGKTTLLRILIGLLAPDKGRITLEDRDITSAHPGEREMGIVFQNFALFENMTVLGNVEYALLLKLKKQNKSDDTKKTTKEIKAEARERSERLLEVMNLTEHKNKKPAELSGGQQQRVAIARTLVLNPEIILFDEPMSALDVATRLSLRAEIKKIQRDFGTTMIYITHDQEEAFAMSDRIMVMEEASIAQLDMPEKIIENPANKYVEDFVIGNLKTKIDSLMKYTK